MNIPGKYIETLTDASKIANPGSVINDNIIEIEIIDTHLSRLNEKVLSEIDANYNFINDLLKMGIDNKEDISHFDKIIELDTELISA